MTTGGNTSGRWSTPSTKVLPGKRERARRKAAPSAKGSAAATATVEIFKLRKSASLSAWLSSIPRSGCGESVAVEDRTGLRAIQEAEIGLHRRARIAFDDGEGIDDGRMALLREDARDLHFLAHARIGDIDDAER